LKVLSVLGTNTTHACPPVLFLWIVRVPRSRTLAIRVVAQNAETAVSVNILSLLKLPRIVLLSIELHNGPALIVRVSPFVRAILREGLETVVHLLGAAPVLAVACFALMSISVDNVVDAVAEDVVWRVLVPGFDALSAAGVAVRKELRGLLAHDQLIHGVRNGVHTRLLLPLEVADLGF